jgi:hypothetical protein
MNRKSFAPTDLVMSETGAVKVAFSRFGVIDKDGDVTFPGALPTGKSVAMSDFNHTSWDGALPVGKGVIGEAGDLGILDGGFFMDTDQGRNAYHTVKAMADIQEWSYGYVPLPPSGPEMFEGKSVRALRKLDVFEVSPVLLGAGVGTGTLAIKSGAPGPDAPYAEHASWVRESVEAFLTRTKARAEMREQMDRKLSRSDREALSALLDSLRAFGGTADELAALLEQTDPQKAAHDVTLEVLLATARRYGVTV